MPHPIDTRKKKFSHSPFTFEWNGVKIACDAKGKITLQQDHPDGTFDEIKTSASMVYRLASMLSASKHIEYLPESDKTNDKSGD